MRNSNPPHNSRKPTDNNIPSKICSAGDVAVASPANRKNRAPAAPTVVPEADAIAWHSPSTALSASCVPATASAAPWVALPTPTTARPRPPGSRRSTEDTTCATNSPTRTGRVIVAMSARFDRNHSADRSTAVVSSSAVSARSPSEAAAAMNAAPSPPST